jgi:ketosteroid isomerase-like protein
VAGSDPLAVFDALFHAVCVERDPDAFIALWADDADTTMWGSDLDERATGADQIEALGEAITASPFALFFTWHERQVHVEGDTAWVNAAGTLAVDSQTTPYRVTGVLVRRYDEWRWHTFNGSEPN